MEGGQKVHTTQGRRNISKPAFYLNPLRKWIKGPKFAEVGLSLGKWLQAG